MLTTLRQSRFVSEYLVDLNATQAAIRAGYSEHTADVQASRLLRNVQIQTAVRHKQRETEKRLQIQREDIIRGFLAAAKEAKQQKDPASMIAAYREIARLQGYYDRQSDDPVDLSEYSIARIQEMSEKELLKLTHDKHNPDLANVADEWVVT